MDFHSKQCQCSKLNQGVDFHCQKPNHTDVCCPKQEQPCPQPSIECLKVLSVICNKNVQKVAELAVPIGDLGITDPTLLDVIDFRVTADPREIVMRGTLLEGKVVNSGFVPVRIEILGVDLPVVNLNLPFQLETECLGACPGDDLQETAPVIEAVIEPVITPQTIAALATITFKVIIRTQITVSREKLVQSSVNVLGDINNDRCITMQPTEATSRTRTFFNGT